MYETKAAKIDRFAGLSDRSHPVALTRIENPKLMNIDFSERIARRRYGYTRINSERLKDASIRLDGVNDYLRIRNRTAYQPSGINTIYIGIAYKLRSKPGSAVTLASMGFGTGVDRAWQIQYNPSTATNPNGAIVCRAYDPTGVTLHTVEIADGDGGSVPVDQYRFVEFYGFLNVATPFLRATMYKEDDTTSTTTSVGNPASLVASPEDITLGVTMSASNTIGTDFADASIAEFRYWVGDVTTVGTRLASSTTHGPLRHRRELTTDEIALYTGYWKLNDGGTSNALVDWVGGNSALIPANPASWVSVDGETLGQSGLQFFGHDAFCALWNTSAVQTLQNPFNTTAGGQVQRWTVRGVFVPKLATGETTVRDQTIFWAGTSATVPGPVALQISGDTWLASYRDGAATVTRSLSGGTNGPTALVGKRVRWALSRYGTGNGTFRLAITWIDSNGAQQQAFQDLALASGATPDTISGFWFIGRHATSITLPYTFASATTDRGAYGVIDDFQVVHTNSLTAAPISHGSAFAFQEKSGWGQPHFVVAYLKMNEGGGNFVLVTSEIPQSLFSFIYPEENDGAHWDVGLVRPYRSPECGGIFDFNRFLPDGSIKRSKIVISGCSIYEFNATTGAVTVIGAAPKATTRWTKDQYAQTAFLAADNGRRPLKYDGTSLVELGIRAPLSAPVLTDAAGGTFTGSYYFYVTFYNKNTGVESNPGPGVQYTYSSRQITQVVIPTSADPQVTGRRLYVTLASGADGSLAFKLAEFDDNTQITWGAATSPFTLTAITAPVSSGTTLEYFEHEEAPQASLVKVFGDNLFVAGNSVFPTRVYRSAVGSPDYFNQDERFVDVDLDTGDPVTGMRPLMDSLFVGLQDGWARVWNTGDSNNPIGKAIMSRDHGPTGPHAMISIDRLVYYFSERDIFRTNGLDEENLSSPPRIDYPSIQQHIKDNVTQRRKRHIIMAHHRQRKQIWIAYTSASGTRNDRVIVYDLSQGVWSDYELNLDFVTELEDDNDEPTLYGAIEGYIVKLDQANQLDGIGTPVKFLVLTYVSGDNPYVTYNSGETITTAHGAIAHIYKKASNTVVKAYCEYWESGKLRFYKQDLGLAAGDIVIVGAIRCHLDWILDFGEAINLKRLRKLLIAGKAASSDTRIRAQWIKHQSERSPTLTLADQAIREWPTDLDLIRIEMGGLGRTFRLRLSECDDASAIFSDDPWPCRNAVPTMFYELQATAEVLDVE